MQRLRKEIRPYFSLSLNGWDALSRVAQRLSCDTRRGFIDMHQKIYIGAVVARYQGRGWPADRKRAVTTAYRFGRVVSTALDGVKEIMITRWLPGPGYGPAWMQSEIRLGQQFLFLDRRHLPIPRVRAIEEALLTTLTPTLDDGSFAVLNEWLHLAASLADHNRPGRNTDPALLSHGLPPPIPLV